MSSLFNVASCLALGVIASVIPSAASAGAGACDESVEIVVDGHELTATLLAQVIRINGVFGPVRFPFIDVDVTGVYELKDGRRIRLDCGAERLE